jgi:hypothetical protein
MIPLAVGLLPAATGFLLVRALSGGNSLRGCRHDVFRLLLGTGIGIGLASECYFLGLVTGSSGLLLEILLLLAAGSGVAWNPKAKCPFCESRSFEAMAQTGDDRFLTRCLAWAFALLLLSGLAVFVWVSARDPRGGWDAWAIWNLRARFLYRNGGVAWRDAFTEVLDWSHPDYPLLLPAFVARGWTLLGRESSAVPIALAGFFTFACAGLMAASLAILRGAPQGLLAGLALAATPWLYAQGAMQCADIPVAFFRLATLAAMALADRFNSLGLAVVAGMAAALGGWAKNEGLLWFGAFLVARMIVARGRLVPAFLAGALPALAPILFFKVRVATSSDIFGAAGRAGMMTRVLEPARYSLIAKEALVHAWNFGPLPVSAFAMLIVYAAVAGLRRWENQDRAILPTGVLALSFTTVGYFVIYLLRPLDLAWLLDTSADRLLLQLWPGIVFVIFLACRAPRRITLPAPIASATRSSKRGIVRPVRGSDDADRYGIC